MNRMSGPTICLLALFFAATDVPAAEGLSAVAQKIADTHHGAVVSVEAVLTVTARPESGPEQKQTSEVSSLGTVIDAAGTVVTSYSRLNAVYLTPHRRMQRGGVVAMSGELSEIRIRLPDGSKVQSKLALMDPDQDLAFLVPVNPLQAKRHIGSAAAAPKLNLLDKVLSLDLGSKSINYLPVLKETAVQAVIQRPSALYVVDATVGTPVFDTSGRLVGICLIKGERNGSTGEGVPPVPAVMPMEQIAAIAKQITPAG